MIEHRKLTRKELGWLLAEAPYSETKNLLKRANGKPYEFLNDLTIESKGIVINGRPIYYWVLTKINGKYELWTIVNSNVKEQFTLYKLARKNIKTLVEKYGCLYATMEKESFKNIEWTKRIGFKVIEETDNLIKLRMEK